MGSNPSEPTSETKIEISYLGPLEAHFNMTSMGDEIADISWEFGDGYQASGNSIKHQYLSPGEYLGKLSYTKNDLLINHDIKIIFDGENQNIIIQPESNIAIDSDHNDPNQSFLSNNITPQILTSPVSLTGLVLAKNACQAGRLCADGDTVDKFLINLSYGDHIRIEVIKGQIDTELLSRNTMSDSFSSSDLAMSNIASAYNINTELTIPSNKMSAGQFQLNIKLNQFYNKAQYIIHIEAEESFIPQNYQPGKLIILWEGSNSPELVDISDPRINNPIASRSSRSLTQARSDLIRQANVKSVSFNYYRKAFNSNTLQWPLEQQKIEQLWTPLAARGQLPGAGTTVAVLDTGLYLQHSNLEGLITHSGYDFISDPINSGDSDGWDSDPSDLGDSSLSYHGSHVTGIIAAQPSQTNNTHYMQGIAWGAEIMPLRVLGLNGGTSYDLIQALRYAAGLNNDSGRLPDKPADIINLSLGGSQFSVAEQATINEVIDSGAIIVAAAGNQGEEKVNYPAAYKDVIAVGATDKFDAITPYSNSGAFIDLVAPGGYCLENSCNDGVYSLSAIGSKQNYYDSRQSSWRSISGTSMATAHVTGLLAIVRSYLPALDAKQLNQLIASQAITTDMNEVGFDKRSGWGKLNSAKLLNLMDSSDLNRASAWVSKTEIYTPANFTSTVDIITRGEIAQNSLTVSYNSAHLDVTINDNKINITTQANFLEQQIVSLNLDNETIATIKLYPQAELKMPEFAPHLYLIFEGGALQTSGLRTVPQSDSWQAQTPPLTSGQVIQASSDIDYDGVYCEMGEFCAYSQYQPDSSGSDIILNGVLLGP
ncbi:MAG: serine protease [Crocinitomicaceae bacterium]|jgi:serine protease